MSSPQTGRTAIVLAGGGARGAYEAGVIRYIRSELARELGFQPRFDIITGTSVGALNACYLAATAEDPERQADELADMWGTLQIEDVFQLPARHLLKVPRWLLQGAEGRMSLLRAEPLERMVTRRCPWNNIRRNIRRGHLETLTVTATHLGTGRVTTFVDGAPDASKQLRLTPFSAARDVRIGPRHALASAAIPMVFPVVPIEGELFCDGGLRQNTPLLPAVSLGADRVLVISLRHPSPTREELPPEEGGTAPAVAPTESGYPSAPFLFGKVLNALLLDQVQHDIERLEDLNALIDEAHARFGDTFVEQLGQLHSPLFGTSFRRIDLLSLAPEADLGQLAQAHLENAAASATGLASRLLRSLASDSGDDDLGSYLLFHGPYARELMDQAMSDCRARRDELAGFFGA